MGNKPLVTVITPTYNCAKFIGGTVESVLSQDYPNIQYIVIDDGSTDKTQEFLAKYKADSRLQVIRHNNMGEHCTVNVGLRLVKGKYFMYPNADDPLFPGAITRLVEIMEACPDVLCAYPDWDSINEDGSLRKHIKTRDYDFNYMVRHHTCLPSVGSMFRAHVIKRIGYRDPSFRWVSDFDYWLRIGLAGKMVRVPHTLACWRNRAGQGSKDKSDLRAIEHVRLMEKFFRRQNVPADIRAIQGEAMSWDYLVGAVVCKSRSMTVKCILKALQAYPKLLFKLEFYDTAIKRARHFLRR